MLSVTTQSIALQNQKKIYSKDTRIKVLLIRYLYVVLIYKYSI